MINKNSACLSDEILAEFTDGLLSGQESTAVQAHLDTCLSCRELVEVHQAVQQPGEENFVVPAEWIEKAKNLIPRKTENILEIAIRFSEKMFEAVQTTGKILWGPGISSGYLLRGDPADPVQVLVVEKMWGPTRAEVTVSRAEKNRHHIALRFADESQKSFPPGTRAALWRDQDELESHPFSRGEISFPLIRPGSYRVKIANSAGEIFVTIAIQLIET